MDHTSDGIHQRVHRGRGLRYAALTEMITEELLPLQETFLKAAADLVLILERQRQYGPTYPLENELRKFKQSYQTLGEIVQAQVEAVKPLLTRARHQTEYVRDARGEMVHTAFPDPAL